MGSFCRTVADWMVPFQGTERETDINTEQQTTAPSFDKLGLHADIVANLRKMDIVTPTEIQVQSVKALMSTSSQCR